MFTLVRVIAAIRCICSTLNEQNIFDLKPLAPDRAGGLRSLGNLALSMTYITIPFLLHVMVYYCWLPEVDAPFVIGLCIITALAVFIFFLPLASTHQAMSEAKSEMLKHVSQEFNLLNKKLVGVIAEAGSSDEDEEKAVFERIKRLDEMYAMINRMPAWPFDISIISRFGVSVLLPIAAVVFDKCV